MEKNNYITTVKSDLKKLSILDISIDKPDLKNNKKSKAVIVGEWIIKWINKDLKSGKISVNDLLPSKPEFAYALGVSIGTVQNAIRYIEDLGYVESKQCIGTLIKDANKRDSNSLRKLTSKKDLTISAIKSYISTNKLKKGDELPNTTVLSEICNSTVNTIRLALETLCGMHLIEKTKKDGRSYSFKVKANALTSEIQTTIEQNKTTLVSEIASEIKEYISKELNTGDRLPAHEQLSKRFKVSIKTIHDSLKLLCQEGIILSKRGTYGTTVLKNPNDKDYSQTPEKSIFAPAQDAAFYHYEKVQNRIKKLIAEEYQIGDKLPSVNELSSRFDLSPNTIRKAYHNLAKSGYLVFSRGRYGGTFVIDIPEIETQTFKWLAVNPQYALEYEQAN